MKIIGVHCPYCGGNVKFDVESGKQSCFCVHCGQQIILDDEVIKIEYVERKIDEARIHEADVKERIKLKELELQQIRENKAARTIKKKAIFAIIYIGIILLGFLAVYFEINNGVDEFLIYLTALFALGLLLIGITIFMKMIGLKFE